ncbi:Hypothetical predicted protein [Paramuricea clavata]|uniref:Uncharacterized protein n=1 Tax=Paramuricea clavata TaxID=317549 RepID=A0A6S7FYM0_PARCT|nr:Hypothetical predicted protein [Paramuricea clavata]
MVDEINWDQLDDWERKRQENLNIIRKSRTFEMFEQRLWGEINAWKYWDEMVEPLEKNKLDISRFLYTAASWGTDGDDPLLDDFINYIYVSAKCCVFNIIIENWKKIVFVK